MTSSHNSPASRQLIGNDENMRIVLEALRNDPKGLQAFLKIMKVDYAERLARVMNVVGISQPSSPPIITENTIPDQQQTV